MPNIGEGTPLKRGLARQQQLWVEAIRAGGTLLGWKVGFGAPSVMARLGIDAPLTGFLLVENRIENGGTCSMRGWQKPAAEPEIAVYIGQSLSGDATPDDVREAIGAVGPAIELADVTFAPDDVEQILAGNIYQRHVILGRKDETRRGANLSGLRGELLLNGLSHGATNDLEANTGRIVDIVGQVSNTLASIGETLRSGQIIIAGSVLPPLFLNPEHEKLAFSLDPIGQAAVELTW